MKSLHWHNVTSYVKGNNKILPTHGSGISIYLLMATIPQHKSFVYVLIVSQYELDTQH